MLIISIPKSASTSLMQTIAKILHIRYQNGISRKHGYRLHELCPGFEEMQKYHGTTIKRSFAFLNNWISRRDIIYKEHLLPTKEHIEYIKTINKPVIILLRKSEDVIDNYLRSVKKFNDGLMNEREQKGLIIKKLITLDFDKLKEEYDEFNAIWKESKLKNALYISFGDLILRYNSTMRKIMRHFGIRKYKIIPMLKAKGNRGDYNTYTGVGERRLKDAR